MMTVTGAAIVFSTLQSASDGRREEEPRRTDVCARGPPLQCVVELPQQLLGHWLGKPCVVGTGFPEHQVKGVITHSHFLDPLHHCHGFLLFIRFHKIRLTCSNSAANRGNSEIHSLDEPAAQRSGTRAERLSTSLRKAGKRRHAIGKPGAWPREVHSLPA